MDINYYAIAALIFRGAAIALLFGYVVPRHIREIRHTKYTEAIRNTLRAILGLYIFILISFIVSFSYQLSRIESSSDLTLENITTTVVNLSNLGIIVMLAMLYKYIWNDDEKS